MNAGRFILPCVSFQKSIYVIYIVERSLSLSLAFFLIFNLNFELTRAHNLRYDVRLLASCVLPVFIYLRYLVHIYLKV